VNIKGLPDINSLPQLVTKEIVSDYIAWCINDRGVKGKTLHNHLGRLEVAMRQHPSYASLNLGWFKPLLESLPIEPETERRTRKAKKYLDYPIIEAIPAKIRAESPSSSKHHAEDVAVRGMEALLIKWLTILPWRQRNIRECRLGGPAPNLFKAKIPNYITIDKPQWVLTEEQKSPETQFWQLHFAPKETKTGKEIRAILPRPLIKPLEEYLAEFRPQLVKTGDPNTLFVSRLGELMKSNTVYNLVTRLTMRHGGRPVNPHLFRDIVAFAWLKEHPRDYLILSKILWHANIQVTIRTYGSRFDESSGVCAMEAWVEEREAKSK
jgi:integrase